MPVTAKEFGKLGLAFPRTEERSHMNHPDFRVCGKIFATLGYPDKAGPWSNSPPSSKKNSTTTNPACSPQSKALGDAKGPPTST